MDFDTIRMARVGSTTPKTSRQTPVPGFSTGDDSSACSLDLNEELLTNPAASFFLRVRGEAMIGAGIFDGDTVIIRSGLKGTEQIATTGSFTLKAELGKGEAAHED